MSARGCFFLFAIMVAVGLVVGLITWTIVLDRLGQPVKLHAAAKLSEFTLDKNKNNNMVRYNLTVNVTIRNPNRKAVMEYDHVEVTACYHSQRLDGVVLAPFHQPRKNTTVLTAAFQGQRQLGRGQFEQDKASGGFGIEVEVFLMVKSRFGKGWFLQTDWSETQRHFPFHLPIQS